MEETELETARLDVKQHRMRKAVPGGRLQCPGRLCKVGSRHPGEAGGCLLHVLSKSQSVKAWVSSLQVLPLT